MILIYSGFLGINCLPAWKVHNVTHDYIIVSVKDKHEQAIHQIIEMYSHTGQYLSHDLQGSPVLLIGYEICTKAENTFI